MQRDLFARTATDIVAEAIERFRPVAIYAGFSGGDDSLSLAHWAMDSVPGCQLFYINTGIGCERTRQFIHETAEWYRWPLTEIRAKEDCGQDYDELVRQYGFPGPYGHGLMYRRLKDRGVELLVRRAKRRWLDKVLLLTGLRADESARRMGYKDREINRRGAQVWVNAIYWWPREKRDDYLMRHQISRNPISKSLDMSGECLCGAFAQPGELERVRLVDPELAARLDRLHDETKGRFPWPWDGRPPRTERRGRDAVSPLCIGCEKSALVQEELRLA